MAESANSARKLPSPMNLSGGSSGITRKNASTVVSAVGTNDSAPMNTTSGESRRKGSSLPRRAALKLTPPYCVVLTGCCDGDVPRCVSSARGLQLADLAGYRADRLLDSLLPGGRLVNVGLHGGAELHVPRRRPVRERRLGVRLENGVQLGRLRDVARLHHQVEAGQPGRQRERAYHVLRSLQPGPGGLVLGGREPLDELHRARNVLGRL